MIAPLRYSLYASPILLSEPVYLSKEWLCLVPNNMVGQYVECGLWFPRVLSGFSGFSSVCSGEVSL